VRGFRRIRARLPGGRCRREAIRRSARPILVALGDFFEALAARHPVVLVVEDLQWADAPSLGALEVLLRRLERRPFFVVGTARPEFEGLLPDFRRVTLSGISRAAIRRLVEAVLGGGARESGVRRSPASDASLKEATALVYERSGGNPFFAEELAMALREGVTDLPASVEAATQSRLDALPPAEKELLRRAAVLGRRFWTEALGRSAWSTSRTCAGVAKPGAPPRLAGDRWRFRHARPGVAYNRSRPKRRPCTARRRVAGACRTRRPRGRPSLRGTAIRRRALLAARRRRRVRERPAAGLRRRRVRSLRSKGGRLRTGATRSGCSMRATCCGARPGRRRGGRDRRHGASRPAAEI
jgi:hypothetical protein